MRHQHEGGSVADGKIERRPARQRGLADQIANARVRRNLAIPSREDFTEDSPPPEPLFEPSHMDFREELRRIIAEDAERAANEQVAPISEAAEELVAPAPSRRHNRLKVAVYWLGCFFGIGAVAYTLTRPV